jgi:hypothetical protein
MVSREEAVANLSAHMRGHATLDHLEMWARHAQADGEYEPEYAAAISQILGLIDAVWTRSRQVGEGEFCLALANLGAFFCPRCGRISWHPRDSAEGYCGACHAVTGTRYAGPAR